MLKGQFIIIIVIIIIIIIIIILYYLLALIIISWFKRNTYYKAQMIPLVHEKARKAQKSSNISI